MQERGTGEKMKCFKNDFNRIFGLLKCVHKHLSTKNVYYKIKYSQDLAMTPRNVGEHEKI